MNRSGILFFLLFLFQYSTKEAGATGEISGDVAPEVQP